MDSTTVEQTINLRNTKLFNPRICSSLFTTWDSDAMDGYITGAAVPEGAHFVTRKNQAMHKK
jgi:hypothetical protein